MQQGFQRRPPVLVTCESNPSLPPLCLHPHSSSWQRHEWRLNAQLAPASQFEEASILLRQRGSAFSIAAASQDDPVWVVLNSREQGAGVASCSMNDEFLLGGTHVRVLAAPEPMAAIAASSSSEASPRPGPALSARIRRFSSAAPSDGVSSPLASAANGSRAVLAATARNLADASHIIGRKVLRFAPMTTSTEYTPHRSGTMRKLLSEATCSSVEEPLKGERKPFHRAFGMAQAARRTLLGGAKHAAEDAEEDELTAEGGTSPSTPSPKLVLGPVRPRPSTGGLADVSDPTGAAPARVAAMSKQRGGLPTLPPMRRRRMREPPAREHAECAALLQSAVGLRVVSNGRGAASKGIGVLSREGALRAPGSVSMAASSTQAAVASSVGKDLCGAAGWPEEAGAAWAELVLQGGDGVALELLSGKLVRIPLGETHDPATHRLLAIVQFHGHRFWLHEPVGERSSPTVTAANLEPGICVRAPVVTARALPVPVHSSSAEEVGEHETGELVKAGQEDKEEEEKEEEEEEGGMSLTMGCLFAFGGASFRMCHPPPEARTAESWSSLACSLQRARLRSVAEQTGQADFVRLPRWQWLNAGTVGRRNNKHASLPLPDLKAKRRHAAFRLEGSAPGTASGLVVSALWLQPWKGKPCRLLLGRHDYTLNHPWRMRLGDVFCVGHSTIRLAQATCPASLIAPEMAPCGAEPGDGGAAAAGGGIAAAASSIAPPLVLMQDRGRRYRRKANKEKRRLRKLGKLSSSSESDDDEDDRSDEERPLGPASRPFVRLEVVDGPWRGKVLNLETSRVLIGSSRHCDVALPTDLTVEEVHACMVEVGGSWYLHDLGSRSGTSLLIPDDGAQLDCGDVVTIGTTELAFFMQDQADARRVEEEAEQEEAAAARAEADSVSIADERSGLMANYEYISG